MQQLNLEWQKDAFLELVVNVVNVYVVREEFVVTVAVTLSARSNMAQPPLRVIAIGLFHIIYVSVKLIVDHLT